MIPWRAWAQATLLLAALAGCASPARSPLPEQAGAALHLVGRLSVQTSNPHSGRPEGGSAGFELSGSPAAGELALSTPLGTLLGRARWREGEVLLQRPGEERRYDSLEALTEDLLGGAIPVAALFDWLRGRPWPGASSDSPPTPGTHGFSQLGWQIDLSGFADGLIVARRLAEPAVTLRARLDP